MAKTILTPEAGISIIEKSIKQASSQKTGAYKYYTIWGTVLFLYFIIQFFALHFKNNATINIADFSTLLFPIGGLLSYLTSRKDDKTETLVPINEKIYTYGWIGASIGLAALYMANLKHMQEMICLGVLVIFGLINFIIGGVVKFTPLIIGGLLSMLLAVVLNFVTFEYQFLITAIGILCSCLIPGLLMKNSTANV